MGLRFNLPPLAPGGRLWVAYSGGMDSHVLLHAMSQNSAYKPLVTALYVNHGLSPNAFAWQTHCQRVCASLEVSFKACQVDIVKTDSGSLESLARDARYAIFNECIGPDDYLLMAHHQNDQFETMLYRLMRGTGPRGLSGIPEQRKLGKGQLIRPLLNYTRQQLEEYASAEGLEWIEDESNQDSEFDRNYLRKEIFPLLKQRWPGFEKSWQRTAQLCEQADALQTVLGEQDLKTVQAPAHANRLDIKALNCFDTLRKSNILRTWFTGLECNYAMAMPDYRSLHRILDEVVLAPEDAKPLVSWANNEGQIEVRRFANELYALKASGITRKGQEPLIPLNWPLNDSLELPLNMGTLKLKEVSSKGMELADIKQLEIRFRNGGEQAKPAGRKTRSLKKIFQDYAVQPWIRDRVPLIYKDDELVAVGDLFICDKWQCEQGRKLYRFCWEKSDIHCGY